jgi:hypothetical protein
VLVVEEYLELSEWKWQSDGEKCILRSFHNFQSSSSALRVKKSRRMRWTGYVTHTHTHTEDMVIASKILVKICEGNRPVLTGTDYTKLCH